MKDFLKKLIKQKEEELKSLIERSDKSTDVAEVRSLGSQIETVKAEKRDAEEQLTIIEAEEQRNADPVPTTEAELRNGVVVGSFAPQARKAETDPYDTPEYRKAFMEFVCRGTAIPAELRTDQVTKTTDVGAVIPTTMMNEIIMKMDTYGNIYNLVRKLNIQGGIAIPTMSLKPEATWVGEAASESKKLETKTSITFSYFGVECKISQSLLASVTTISAFQQLFVPLATEAIVKAVEKAIFNGNGTSQPKGILTDSRVPSGNTIELTPAEFKSWSAWHKKVKAKMKKAYRNGIFVMNQATFDGYIDGMVDDNGQPVGRINYGINGEETYRFMGKAVETVEDDLIQSFDDASQSEVVAVFFKPTDYAINSNLQMTTVKWVDNDTNEVKNKCILICDGKLIDPNGVLIIKKGNQI